MEEEESWIASFCNVVGHEYFAEVTEDFIEDDFNLTGLGAVVPMYATIPAVVRYRRVCRVVGGKEITD